MGFCVWECTLTLRPIQRMAELHVWTWAFAPDPPSTAGTCWVAAVAGGKVADDGRPSTSPPPRPRSYPSPPDPMPSVGVHSRRHRRWNDSIGIVPRGPGGRCLLQATDPNPEYRKLPAYVRPSGPLHVEHSCSVPSCLPCPATPRPSDPHRQHRYCREAFPVLLGLVFRLPGL